MYTATSRDQHTSRHTASRRRTPGPHPLTHRPTPQDTVQRTRGPRPFFERMRSSESTEDLVRSRISTRPGSENWNRAVPLGQPHEHRGAGSAPAARAVGDRSARARAHARRPRRGRGRGRTGAARRGGGGGSPPLLPVPRSVQRGAAARHHHRSTSSAPAARRARGGRWWSARSTRWYERGGRSRACAHAKRGSRVRKRLPGQSECVRSNSPAAARPARPAVRRRRRGDEERLGPLVLDLPASELDASAIALWPSSRARRRVVGRLQRDLPAAKGAPGTYQPRAGRLRPLEAAASLKGAHRRWAKALAPHARAARARPLGPSGVPARIVGTAAVVG